MTTTTTTHRRTYIPCKITPREREVLHLIAYEHSTKEIATKLYVSYETANTHRRNIMDKLGAKNTAGVVRLAYERGLMQVGQVMCVLLALITFSPLSNAQFLSGQKYNYEVHSIGGWMNYNEGGSDEEVTWLTGACHDTDDTATQVIPNYSNVGTTTCSGPIWCDALDGDFDGGLAHYWDRKLLVAMDKSDTEFDYTFRSWEDDGNRCVEDNDDNRGTAWGRIHATNWESESSKWSGSNTISNSANNSDVKFKSIWRYTKGRKDNAFDFGTINGSKYHINSNRIAPDGADSDMGYTNDWGNLIRPDVTYEFTIADEAKTVTISTNFSTTDFDTRLYLYEGSTLLQNHDDIAGVNNRKSLLTRVLCPGTYAVVVAGYADGDFLVQVSTSSYSFNAGTLSSSTNQTIACKDIKIETINGSVVPDLYDNEPVYQWKIWDFANLEYINVATGTSTLKNLSNYGDMNEQDLYFRRDVTICGVKKSTNFYFIEYQPSSIIPGEIHYNFDGDNDPNTGSDVRESYLMPGSITVKTTASGDPSPITYRWIKKLQSASGFVPITSGGSNYTGSTLPGNVLGPVQLGFTNIKRIAINDCGLELESNEVTIEGRAADGSIMGKVTAPPLNNGVGVGGVSVCGTPIISAHGTEEVCTTTNGQGEYTLNNLYFEKTGVTTYKVTPLFAGHQIRNDETSMDSTRNIDLNTTTHNITTGANFVDLTVFTVKGKVTQLFQEPGQPDALFGKSKVIIYIQDSPSGVKIPKDTTDASGDYSVIIQNAGTWIITPELVETGTLTPHEHAFSPMSQSVLVSDNVTGIDFANTTTMDINGFIGAGCTKYLGMVDLRFFQDPADGTFDRTFQTTGNGTFNFTLPARKYKVMIGDDSITDTPEDGNGNDLFNVAKANDQFKQFAFEAELSHMDTSFTLFYRAPPVIQIVGEPMNVSCDAGTYNFPVLEQGKIYKDFKIIVWEGNPLNFCKLDTGFVDITDDIGSRGSATLPVSNGFVNFQLQGGFPNVVAVTNYRKTSNFLAKDFINTEGSPYSLTALVTGEKPKKSTFVTVSPEIPLYVLHDPPTDNGYSFLINESVKETSLRNFAKKDNTDGGWLRLKVGAAISQSFGIGAEMGFNIEGWVIGTGHHDVSEVHNTTDEVTIRITHNQEIKTSANPIAIGDAADVFFGAAFNYTYSLTDKVAFDTKVCEIDTSTSFLLDPDSIATTFIKTTRGIENTIDELRNIKSIQHPDSMLYYQNQINVWEQTLAKNREYKAEKSKSAPIKNYTIDGNVFLGESHTIDTTEVNGIEYWVAIDKGLAIEAGLEVAGNGISDSYFAKVRTEIGGSKDTTITNAVTTGFTLEDDDPDDKFTIGIYNDDRYGTPIFDLKSGLTSCPYEAPKFLGLDQFLYSHHPSSVPSQTDILPAVGASYKFVLANTGPVTRIYMVSKDDAYNPDAAEIKIGNNAPGLPGFFTLDSPMNPNPTSPTSVEITVIVNKSPAVNVFSYRNLKIDVDPNCNPSTLPDSSRQTLFISASFRGDCSQLDITSPSDNRIVNINDNNTLPIRLQNYDKNKLDRTVLQYRKKGFGTWSSSATLDLTSAQLEGGPSGTQVDWDLTELQLEGEVEIRFLVTCTVPGTAITNVNYSNIVSLVVDREKPTVFGIPSPIDDIYDIAANDELSVSYNEDVCSLGSTTATATIIDLVDGYTTPGTVTCSGNVVKIVEQGVSKIVEQGVSLNNRLPSAYRVILSGVTDMHGNVADTYRWVFVVGAYSPTELGCVADLEITNNNENQDAINVSTYRALNITSDGLIPNFGSTSYNAQDSIIFGAGFEVTTGGVFNAQIENCNE